MDGFHCFVPAGASRPSSIVGHMDHQFAKRFDRDPTLQRATYVIAQLVLVPLHGKKRNRNQATLSRGQVST